MIYKPGTSASLFKMATQMSQVNIFVKMGYKPVQNFRMWVAYVLFFQGAILKFAFRKKYKSFSLVKNVKKDLCFFDQKIFFHKFNFVIFSLVKNVKKDLCFFLLKNYFLCSFLF